MKVPAAHDSYGVRSRRFGAGCFRSVVEVSTDGKCTRFQSVNFADCKRAHYPSVETSTDRKYGHFQSAKLTEWKVRRFHSLVSAKHRSPSDAGAVFHPDYYCPS